LHVILFPLVTDVHIKSLDPATTRLSYFGRTGIALRCLNEGSFMYLSPSMYILE